MNSFSNWFPVPSFGFSQPSRHPYSKDVIDSDSGDSTEKEDSKLATYTVPGSAIVQICGSPKARSVASLQQGEKILCIDLAANDALSWTTLHRVEVTPPTAKLQKAVTVELEGGDSMTLKAEQVVLAKDRKQKPVMRPARRLEVFVNSVIVVNADDYAVADYVANATDDRQSRSGITKSEKKVTSLAIENSAQVVTETLYKLTVGSTDQSILMSCAADAKRFLVVDPTNSTIDLKAVNTFNRTATTCTVAKVQIKNTFVEALSAENNEDVKSQGIPRSYSDTDLCRLESLEMNELRAFPPSLSGLEDKLTVTDSSESNETSCESSMPKSEASSLSQGSISCIRIGTKAGYSEDGKFKSEGTDAIHFSEFVNLPVNEHGVRLSAATMDHRPGRRSGCHKCAYATMAAERRGKTCRHGALCDFCHESHPRFIHRIKK